MLLLLFCLMLRSDLKLKLHYFIFIFILLEILLPTNHNYKWIWDFLKNNKSIPHSNEILSTDYCMSSNNNNNKTPNTILNALQNSYFKYHTHRPCTSICIYVCMCVCLLVAARRATPTKKLQLSTHTGKYFSAPKFSCDVTNDLVDF